MIKSCFKENQKKRIAYIYNHSFFLGGGEISFFELVRSINRKAFEPVIIVPASGEIEEMYSKKNEVVFVSPFPPLKDIITGTPLYAIKKLITILKQRRVDIIHVNGSRACYYSGWAGRMLGIPVVWHVRETQKDIFLYDGLLSLLSNVIICVSKSVRSKRFERFGKITNKKINIVYNGIDTSKFSKSAKDRQYIRDRFFLKEDEVVFGVVGNIIPRKGQDFFLKGLARAKELKPDLSDKALFIGHHLDPSFSKMLNQLVLDLNLKDTVLFRNYSNEITGIYSAIDIFALPSKSEGFSRSLLEAMSMSLPIVASKISEIEEAVVQGENALLVECSDIDQMAAAIIKLSEDEVLKMNMGEKNRKRAVEHFDLQSHVKAIEKIYTRLLSR